MLYVQIGILLCQLRQSLRRAINHELRAFDAALAAKPQIVVANKMDLVEARERYPALRERFAARGVELQAISAATGEGVAALMREVGRRWLALRRAALLEAGAAHQEEPVDSRL